MISHHVTASALLFVSSNCDVYIEPLDGTRVHPENYEWARKMAEDALEYDEVRKKCMYICCSLIR